MAAIAPFADIVIAYNGNVVDDLVQKTRQLVGELRSFTTGHDGMERALLNVMQPFLQTLEDDGLPQRGSTEALSRFCTEQMDWASPLFRRCSQIVEQARSLL